MATAMNRSSITLPEAVGSEILAKVQEESAVMKLARKINLPGTGVTIPVILGDPEADWVEEGAAKPVKNSTLSKKTIRPYKLAVIEPFSMEFKRDYEALYNELQARLPKALGLKFDKTVFGAVSAPGSDFDTLAACTAQSFGTDIYAALLAAYGDVADNDGAVNGYVISPKAKVALLGAKDTTGRPLFTDSMHSDNVGSLLGAPTYESKGSFITGSPNVLGFAGDWTQAVYGTVEGIQVTTSDEATLEVSETETINLFQQNMFAVRAEIEIGFRCDTTVFNKLTV